MAGALRVPVSGFAGHGRGATVSFGRYLLIGSSRPGGLPANLQGVWAEEIQTPWNGDRHLVSVDIEWNDGNVTHYRIASPDPQQVMLRVNSETRTIQSEKM